MKPKTQPPLPSDKTPLPGERLETLILTTAQKREKLYERWRQKPAGRLWCQHLSELADSVIRTLQEMVWQNAPKPPEVAIVATGGYGRKELAPRSDLDITFIPLNEEDPLTENAVRDLFRTLIHVFSRLDWNVGYAYRLPGDCPALDPVTRSGLLDARLIAGSERAFRQFLQAFQKTFPIADYLIYKLEEREQALNKFGDTPRKVEFHLREGAGGLREAQTAKALASLLRFPLPGLYEKDYDFLLKIRNGLHILTGRKQDVLVRTRLGELARALSLQPQELSGNLIASAERIHSAWLQARQQALQAKFPLAPYVQAKRGACVISPKASVADSALGVYRASKLGLAIPKMKKNHAKTRPPGDIPRVVECLTSNERALRALDESGLLDILIPEFARTKTLLPNDPSHLYSVGEHSLRVVSALDQLRKNPDYENVCSAISNWRPLYLAALLHDVGKAIPGKPHSKTGAQIAKKVCKRLGIYGEERDTVVWLVKEHLTLPHIARTHDLSIPQTAYSVARMCQRQDRMAMLYLLTIADTSSVNPEALTPQMASALRQLYERASSALGKEEPPQDLALFRSEALRRLQTHTPFQSLEDVEEFLNIMPTHYLLATPWEHFALHAEYVRQAKRGETTVVFQHRRDDHITDITICTPDLPQPGLLSQILGIIYALDITIHEARAASTREPQPIALDVISTSYQGHCLPENLCRILSRELKTRLGNAQAVNAWIREKGKDPERRQEMLTYRFHEGNPAILDIETPLGRGMPYRVTKMLASLGWNVEVARIGQWAGRAVARFYVSSPKNKALTRREVQRRLKNL